MKPHLKKIDGKWVCSNGNVFNKGRTIQEAYIGYYIKSLCDENKIVSNTQCTVEWMKPVWMN